MLETERLRLRPFREADREPFARINADPRVHLWFGGPVDRAASDANLDAANAHIARHGFGLWAAEHKADGRLVGMIGLRHAPDWVPLAPAIEAGWHLAADDWGRGLAAEGARAALDWGLARLGAKEIIALTAALNHRSQAVMRRAGMVEQPARAFLHPGLPPGHPLRLQVVYARAAARKTAQAASIAEGSPPVAAALSATLIAS